MTGALNPVVTAQVESFVSGNVKSWSCDFNSLVTAGQICALIDPLPFQVIVDQGTASVHSAMAQLATFRRKNDVPCRGDFTGGAGHCLQDRT
jgi:HlyD family secretion protein